ncbi:MAG TPA: histidinol-phosphate transaminase [Tepidisphaeraceae bacterium]|jgi:histidinol-phosphate aminotransferase|nr:histidinol-phosphate transaminase [Tepidisphaeraceae bacterium]
MALDFIRPTIRDMQGYAPGEQPAAGERVVKLNTNENPFPPSPRVVQAIREMEPEMLRRYPDPNAVSFCNAAAKIHDISSDMILTGNGSDDILAIAVKIFLGPGDTLAVPHPTYSLYPVLAELDEVKFTTIDWDRDWSLPIDGLLAAKPRAIFLANPNAPSGTMVSPLKLEELAQKFKGLLLIDEAYVDFADDNCLPLVKKYENIVISRTLSKAYSLAGLRFGYAVAQPAVIKEMNKAKDSYPNDALSIVAATAAIEDQEYARKSWDHVKAERQRVSSELTQMGWKILPSQTNFILAATPSGNGKAAYQGLKQQGILVRFFNKPGLSDKIRITIGTSQENNALLAGLKALSATEKAA